MNEENYAGFWIRLAAVIIDIAIITVVLVIPAAFIFGRGLQGGGTSAMDILLDYVLPFVITIWFWMKYLGTPGKMILKLKVVDKDSLEALSLGQAIGRYFAYLIAMIPLCFGLVWIAFDDKKQGWHDKLAGSVVIRGE